MIFGDWKVQLLPDWRSDRGDQLICYAPGSDSSSSYLSGWDEHGNAIMVKVPYDEAGPEIEFPRMPRGLAEAIAEAVKPGPNSDEVKRLEEALKHERERVDRVINWATTQMIPR